MISSIWRSNFSFAKFYDTQLIIAYSIEANVTHIEFRAAYEDSQQEVPPYIPTYIYTRKFLHPTNHDLHEQ